MEVRDGLWYTEEHEWARIEDKLTFQKDFGYVESAKLVNVVHSPVSGEVIEVNSKLEKRPELVNSDPYGEGWMVKIKMNNKNELSELFNGREYSELMDHLV